MEAFFKQHPGAEVSDKGEDDHAGYHDKYGCRAAFKQRIQHNVQQKSSAQRRAYRDAVFENGAQAADGDNVSGSLHPALSEYQKRGDREDKTDGAVNDHGQPVPE